ncbi:MAG TPA: hypothetical protein VL371_13990, partial [Gemmataceae bacterium]|nr:hypothetical protein [Gemmataceae bacterium]
MQFGVLERVGLTIQGRRDEDFRRHRFAVEVANDRPQGLATDAVGVLDRVGVDLAVLDGALPFRLAVEGDDLDLVRLVGLFQRRPRAEGGRVVDGEDAREVGVRLDQPLGRFEAGVLVAAAGQFGDDVDLAARRLAVVFVDHFLEALDAE